MKKKALRARGAELPAVSGQQGEYASLLRDVKDRIRRAQVRAVLSVNAELVRLYWDIGRIIHERQQREGWGSGVIPRLAAELKNELPDLKGFSARNIDRMLSFHRDYPDPAAIVQQPAAQLPAIPISPQPVSKIRTAPISQPPVARIEDIAILQQPAGELPPPAEVPRPAALLPGSLLWSIPWAHHVILMQKVKDLATRRWYMEQTLAGSWSRNILAMQIDSQAHARQGKAVSNFAAALPAPQSDLITQTLKDPYIFDFLTLTEPFQERELETELIRHLEKFLLELGQGFAFVGRQYRLDVGDEDFYIDLLFYHLRLRAFVVIDVKKGKFTPEYAGKLNFYCNVVNDQLRHGSDGPTIGLILCQTNSRVLAEYALSGIDKPIGVSSYQLTRALPASLKSALPTVEEIEAELASAEAKEAKGTRAARKAAKENRANRKRPRSGQGD